MQKPTIKTIINNSDLPLLLPPVQSPSLLVNKRESRRQSYTTDQEDSSKRNSSKRSSKLLTQLILQQQQQYETTIQIATQSKEINYLTDKLLYSEEKVSKWKNEFKDMKSKYYQLLAEQAVTKQELEDTRRMLEESEHIRSRWFIKQQQNGTEQQVPAYTVTPPQPPTKKSRNYSRSLPTNLLRFFKKK